jgi:hypothetical protein
MEIKKGLTFQMACQHVKDRWAWFLGAIAGTILTIYLLIALAENRVISEKLVITMSQGLVIGVLFLLWGIICGKFSRKE